MLPDLSPNLSSILSDLLTPAAGSDLPGAPPTDPSPVPSLPTVTAGLPMASPPPSVASLLPSISAPPQPHGAGDLIRTLAPMLIAAVTGARNPLEGAALASGYAQGANAALNQKLTLQARAEQQRQLAAKFMQQTAADVHQFKDPLQRQQYLTFADKLGAEQFGLAPGWTQSVPGHDATDGTFAALKDELTQKLQQFDSDKKWASVAGTPAEAKISFKLSDGSTVPVSTARQIAGQAVYNSDGSQAFAPAPPDPGKTAEERMADLQMQIRTATARGDKQTAATLQAQYDAIKQAKQDLSVPKAPAAVGSFEDYVTRKYGQSPTPAQLEQARRTWSASGTQGGMTGTPDSGGLSPDGVEYAATLFRLTNQMPPLGMGKNPDRARIINQAASDAKALGQTPAAAIQRTALYKSDAKSLERITLLSSTAEAAESKALGQMQLIGDLSQKVNRSQYPIINRALLAGQTNIAGDPNATALMNAVSTFANEYGKIIEGSTGSVTGSSDAARTAAGRLVSAAMNPAQLQKVLSVMQREMDLTIQGYDVTKNEITKRMGGVPAAPIPPPPPAGKPTQIGRFTVTVGGGD